MATVSRTFAFATSAEGYVSTAGAATTMTWDSTVGNPAGALKTRTAGRGKTDANYWEWTGAWEALGVPVGSEVTGIQLTSASTRCSEYNVGSTSTIGPYELRDAAGALVGTLWSGRSVSASSASWTATASQAAVTFAAQPSATTIKLRLADTLATGANNAAAVTVYDDQVALTVTYQAVVAQTYPFAGAVASVSGMAASLVLVAAMSGAVAGVSAVSGDFTVTQPAVVHDFAASTAATSSTSGNLAGVYRLAGSTGGTSDTSGALTGRYALSGVAPAVTTTTVTLALRASLAGSVAGVSAQSGSLNIVGGPVTYPFAGTVSATTTATGGMTWRLVLGGTTSATATTTGALTSVTPLAGTVEALTDVVGDFTVITGGTVTPVRDLDLVAHLAGNRYTLDLAPDYLSSALTPDHLAATVAPDRYRTELA